MAGWLQRVRDAIKVDDLELVVEAFAHFERRVVEGQLWLNTLGRSRPSEQILIVTVEKQLPGMMAWYFNDAQEAEAIREHLNDQATAMKVKVVQRFKEHYNRDVSDSMAKTYAEGDGAYLAMRELIQSFTMVTEQLKGITKGLDSLKYNIGDIVKLRIAGIEDATL